MLATTSQEQEGNDDGGYNAPGAHAWGVQQLRHAPGHGSSVSKSSYRTAVRQLTRLVSRAIWARGVFPHQFAWLLDNPLRRCILSPTTLADRLRLRATDAVVEVGPGSGFFSVELARRVPAGSLQLVDIQHEMLTRARRKVDAHGLTNVRYTVADAGREIPFADNVCDAAVLVSVLGEVEDRTACLTALHRVLKAGGTLAIHESVPDPDRIAIEELSGSVEPSGFAFLRRIGRRYNYTALFRRM